MEKKLSKKILIATFLGNIVEHYDKALFGLIAPFIAPLFFPKSDPIVALILIYLPIGLLARPLGALYWARIENLFGTKRVLYFSILGMSLTILLTGLLPTYKTLGILSAFLLHLKTGMSCFFAAGEATGASILLVENTDNKSKDIMSSLYETSTMVGVFIASLIITLLCFKGKVLEYWRFLFVISGLLGLVGFWFRRGAFDIEKKSIKKERVAREPLISMIKSNWLPFLAIISLSGFLYSNYRVLTNLMNAYLPITSKITYKEMMLMHTSLILYDALMLPFFGFVSKRWGKEKLITFSLIIAAIFIIPFFMMLKSPSLSNIVFIRMSMVTWGIAIAAPFSYWAMSLIAKKDRFRLISLAKAFGGQWIGGAAISISLLIYKITGWISSPAIYVFATALFPIILLSILRLQKRKPIPIQ